MFMLWSVVAQVFELMLDVLGVLKQSELETEIEILLLRQQLRLLERKQRRPPQVSRWEKLTLAVLAARLKEKTKAGRQRLTDSLLLFQPETVLKWHRELVKRKWSFRRLNRRAGNRPLAAELETLIVQLALENPGWGYKKRVGELLKLGYRVGRSTVRNVLKRHHILPAPERRRSRNWRTFVQSHQAQLLATDFFTVETIWLKTVYGLFFIELKTRRVFLSGCSQHPTSAWVTQPARQVSWELGENQQPPKRFLIHDCDTKYTASFDAVFQSEGLEIIRTPYRTPNANAFAERWVRTVREKCLDPLLIFSERGLHRVLTDYVHYYNTASPHQGLQQQTPLPYIPSPPDGVIRRRSVVGGLIHDYYREAA